MRRRASTLAARAGLNEAETFYLREAMAFLDRLPKRVRTELATEVIETLSGRPEGALPELVASLGEPADLVSRLRSETGFPGPVPLWRRWWMQSHWWHGLQGLVLVAAVVGAVSWRNYVGATPEFFNSCGGVAATDWERIEAAGQTEYRAPFREGQRYGVMLCPHTSATGVTIESITVRVPGRHLVQPVGWEVSLERMSSTWVGDASNHRSWSPDDVPWLADVVVWLEAEYCNHAGQIWVANVEISYRYRSRSRTTTLPLGYILAIVTEEQCDDERRALMDAESAAWRDAVDMEIVRSVDAGVDGLGEMHLAPESVSRDLCRYLRGVVPAGGYEDVEPLGARAVFRLDNVALSETLVDGAVLGICPEFADRRNELVGVLSEVSGG